MTTDGKKRETTVVTSDDEEAHRVYTRILQTCNDIGHKIAQYPCPAMEHFRKKLESYVLECKFIEPDVDACVLWTYSSDPNVEGWEMDIGGYALENPYIKEVLVQEHGKAEYKYVSHGESSGSYEWVVEKKYDYKYLNRDPQLHNVDCRGVLQKDTYKLTFVTPVVDFLWGPVGASGVQRLNEDSQLRQMLMKTKVPEINLKYNSILITDTRVPSEKLFRCVERIAEHMMQEPIYVEREEPVGVSQPKTQRTERSTGLICNRCGKSILGMPFKAKGGNEVLCARCKVKVL
jgi:hypothetical protein